MNNIQRILQYLSDKTATVAMIKKATGIRVRMVKHYLNELQKAEVLWRVDYKPCRESGAMDHYFTSNPDFAIPCFNQLKLWEIQR